MRKRFRGSRRSLNPRFKQRLKQKRIQTPFPIPNLNFIFSPPGLPLSSSSKRLKEIGDPADFLKERTMLFPEPKERRFRRIYDLAGFVWGSMMFFYVIDESLPELQKASHDEALSQIVGCFFLCTLGGLFFGGMTRWSMRKWLRFVGQRA